MILFVKYVGLEGLTKKIHRYPVFEIKKNKKKILFSSSSYSILNFLKTCFSYVVCES